jgi:hypothetical protein
MLPKLHDRSEQATVRRYGDKGSSRDYKSDGILLYGGFGKVVHRLAWAAAVFGGNACC